MPHDHSITSDEIVPVYKVISDLENCLTERRLIVTTEQKGRERKLWAVKEKRDMLGDNEMSAGTKIKKTKIGKRRSSIKRSPEKFNFSANFTPQEKTFEVNASAERVSTFPKQDRSIQQMTDFDRNMYESVDNFESMKVNPSVNSVYEDPRDILTSPKTISTREASKSKGRWKEKKRRLVKKYEGLIVGLMERVEENTSEIIEKDSKLSKLKHKLKTVLEYNTRFADENDQARRQLEEYQRTLRDLQVDNQQLLARIAELETARNEPPESRVQVVEACMSCNTREIVLRQLQQQNDSLRQDITAMKDIIYRLNMELSKHQQKLKSSESTLKRDHSPELSKENECTSEIRKAADVEYSNVVNTSRGNAAVEKDNIDDHLPPYSTVAKSKPENAESIKASALAPLFEAYQDSIHEKDILILDYEKRFSHFNQKMRRTLQENRDLSDNLAACGAEIRRLKEELRRCVAEKETRELDNVALSERTEKAERKLKEVYEIYEDKIAALTRDYATLHNEYFATRSALAQARARLQRADDTETRTVPADLHERSLADCRRLLEDLKQQYGAEQSRLENELSVLRKRCQDCEESRLRVKKETEKLKADLKAALKHVRLYRRAAVIFRSRLRAAAASLGSLRRARRRPRPAPATLPPHIQPALARVDSVRKQLQLVKANAYRELEEVERRMRLQREEHEAETRRLRLLLDHKEDIIRKLIDKVATVEAHSIRPYEFDCTTTRATRLAETVGVDKRGSIRLVPAPGGYFQDCGTRSTGGKNKLTVS